MVAMAKVKTGKLLNPGEFTALSILGDELFYALADQNINDARHTRNIELMANACVLMKAVSHNLTHFTQPDC